MVKAIFFDVANTLLQKKDFQKKITQVLENHGYFINSDTLQERHKLILEIIDFPDHTTKEFYNHFNKQFLFLLGIVPDEQLISEIYENTRPLPWSPFEDTSVLDQINLPMGILSNWDNTLTSK